MGGSLRPASRNGMTSATPAVLAERPAGSARPACAPAAGSAGAAGEDFLTLSRCQPGEGTRPTVDLRAHNPKVAGSNPAPATQEEPGNRAKSAGDLWGARLLGLTDYRLTTPKSGKVRAVPMAPDVASALAKLPDRDRHTGTTTSRSPKRPTCRSRAARSAALRGRAARAGLPPPRFHDLRHTFGT